MHGPQLIGNSEDLYGRCVLYTVYAVKGFLKKHEGFVSGSRGTPFYTVNDCSNLCVVVYVVIKQ